MNPSSPRIVLPLLALSLAIAACGKTAAPDAKTASAEPVERPVPERAAEAAASGTVYTCSEGTTIKIDEAGLKADVARHDGGFVTLPRAESASKGGGDVFVGETQSVIREGRTAQLQGDEGAAIGCNAP